MLRIIIIVYVLAAINMLYRVADQYLRGKRFHLHWG